MENKVEIYKFKTKPHGDFERTVLKQLIDEYTSEHRKVSNNVYN